MTRNNKRYEKLEKLLRAFYSQSNFKMICRKRVAFFSDEASVLVLFATSLCRNNYCKRVSLSALVSNLLMKTRSLLYKVRRSLTVTLCQIRQPVVE